MTGGVSPGEAKRPSGARQMGLVLAALFAVLALTNFNVVFLGQTLVASANYSPFDNRGTHLRPTARVGHSFANWHDLGGTWWQWEPAAVAFSDAFRRGEVPLWDPAMAGGSAQWPGAANNTGDQGIGGILAALGTPGFAIGRVEDAMGLRGIPEAELIFIANLLFVYLVIQFVMI